MNGIEADLDRALLNKYATKTANYTVAAGDSVIYADSTSAGFTVTLPDPTTVAANSTYVVKNIAAGTSNNKVTIASAGTSKKIDNQTSVYLYAGSAMDFASDGTMWRIVRQGVSANVNGGSYVDNNGGQWFFTNNGGTITTLGVSWQAGTKAFTVSSAGDITTLKQNSCAIGTQDTGQPTDNTNYGLRVGSAQSDGASPGRLWHKPWGFGGTAGWASVTASSAYATKTASYTLVSTDETVIFNGSSLTCTLPDPTGSAMSGRVYYVKNINSSSLSVVSAGTSKTIDGASSVAVAQWGGLNVISDGTQWLIRSKI
jgi:hypothetical protein